MAMETREKLHNEQDIERIKAILAATAERYQAKGGDIQFAGIEGPDTVRIAPSGFCWR